MLKCEICGKGTVKEIVTKNRYHKEVCIKYYDGCEYCGLEYADAEQIDWNAEQMRKWKEQNSIS